MLITAANLRVASHLRHLYAHLLENRFLEEITGFNPAFLNISSRDVLAKIKARDPSWEKMVPPSVAAQIKRLGLFDCPLDLPASAG